MKNTAHPTTIIIPVYGDWPSLKECIASLKEHVSTKTHQVMFVNDCGPEVDFIEKGIKKEIQDSKNFIYYRNIENLGFVGTCNRAVLELDKTDNDVLLLNSDTKVTEGFLEEMSEVLYSKDDIGVVSPRTNNATIATLPLWAAPQKGIGAEKSYEIFKKVKSSMAKATIVPVAHGFCMLIRRNLIKKYGLFDTVFGKGYGEEVDFCMRIKKHGYKCALSNQAYVFHLEARSFTLEAKAKMLEKNNQIIWKRYPDYRQTVSEYMQEALVKENNILESAGIGSAFIETNYLKRLIKRNKRIHKLASAIRKSIKNTGE